MTNKFLKLTLLLFICVTCIYFICDTIILYTGCTIVCLPIKQFIISVIDFILSYLCTPIQAEEKDPVSIIKPAGFFNPQALTKVGVYFCLDLTCRQLPVSNWNIDSLLSHTSIGNLPEFVPGILKQSTMFFVSSFIGDWINYFLSTVFSTVSPTEVPTETSTYNTGTIHTGIALLDSAHRNDTTANNSTPPENTNLPPIEDVNNSTTPENTNLPPAENVNNNIPPVENTNNNTLDHDISIENTGNTNDLKKRVDDLINDNNKLKDELNDFKVANTLLEENLNDARNKLSGTINQLNSEVVENRLLKNRLTEADKFEVQYNILSGVYEKTKIRLDNIIEVNDELNDSLSTKFWELSAHNTMLVDLVETANKKYSTARNELNVLHTHNHKLLDGVIRTRLADKSPFSVSVVNVILEDNDRLHVYSDGVIKLFLNENISFEDREAAHKRYTRIYNFICSIKSDKILNMELLPKLSEKVGVDTLFSSLQRSATYTQSDLPSPGFIKKFKLHNTDLLNKGDLSKYLNNILDFSVGVGHVNDNAMTCIMNIYNNN